MLVTGNAVRPVPAFVVGEGTAMRGYDVLAVTPELGATLLAPRASLLVIRDAEAGELAPARTPRGYGCSDAFETEA